jgi:hypothetical protein
MTMTGCYGNHPEDKARERELHDHLAKEEREVRRAEAIEARAYEMLKEGAVCYPLDPNNFGEVLAELSVEQVKTITTYLETTQKAGFSFQINNEMVCRMLWVYAEEYWRKCAMSRAEKEVE